MMKTPLGYHLNQSGEQEEMALHKAFALVQKAKLCGMQIRGWAHQSILETQMFHKKMRQGSALSRHAKVLEIDNFERRMIHGIYEYMIESTEILNGLKPLNPPLRSSQIRPFSEAIISDRNITVTVLNSLNQALDSLKTLKYALHLAA